MNEERIFRAVGAVGDDLIARAAQARVQKNVQWKKITALAACCVLIVGAAALILPHMGGKSADTCSDTTAAVTAETGRSADAADSSPRVSAESPESAAQSMGEEEAVPAETEDSLVDGAGETATVPWIELHGVRYTRAPENDGAHLAAEEGDGAGRGDVLGTVTDASSPEHVGCTVYSYCEAGYVLLEADGQYVLYRQDAQ